MSDNREKMAVAKDLRLLTLYKQHYRDKYNSGHLDSMYSCWGYYDGMTLERINGKKSELFTKKSDSPISELWYQDAEEAEKLNGTYGVQNIGLFRYAKQPEDIEQGCAFWQENSKMPYLTAGFLQLKDDIDHTLFGRKLEKKYSCSKETSIYTYRTLTYCTFDNADLVILIQGNSIKTLEHIAYEIQNESEVLYLHCISGASEKYISKTDETDCHAGDSIAALSCCWNGTDCNIDEKLAEIVISIASAGSDTILQWLKYQLKILFPNEKIIYSKATGHVSTIIHIESPTVRQLLLMIRRDGLSSHQNVLYENGVYNIETSIIVDIHSLEITPTEPPEKSAPPNPGWCEQMITKYIGAFKEAKLKNDESLYSYYQALLQTLNVLGQYEKFSQAKKIFYELFPSFRLFFKQLDFAFSQIEQKNEQEQLDEIKDSMCQYLEAVNSVMYHTTHTDQMFLMIPGYCGTTYSIPVKLNLFYSRLCSQVIEILNDAGWQYEVLLAPAIEAKPVTSMIGFGLGHGDRLITVRASQRLLYMPRDFMIILTHEIAHYVGDTIRLRELRLQMLIRTLASIIRYAICDNPAQYIPNGSLCTVLYNTNAMHIEQHIIKRMHEHLDKKCGNDGYHASDISDALKNVYRAVLAEENQGVHKLIYSCDIRLMTALKKNHKDIRKEMEALRDYQELCDLNRKQLLASENIMTRMIDELITIYREVFSDAAALAILGFDTVYFQEAFDISEGRKDAYKDEARFLIRENILNSLRQTDSRAEPALLSDPEITPLMCSTDLGENKIYPRAEVILEYLYSYDSTQLYLKLYAEECYNQILKRMNSPIKEDYLRDIREIFQMFTGNINCNGQQIYDRIMEQVNAYIKIVKQIPAD